MFDERLNQIEAQVAERGAALLIQSERGDKMVAEAGTRLENQLKAQLEGVSEAEEKKLIRRLHAKRQNKELNRARREAYAEAEEQVDAIMGKVNEYESVVAQVEPLYQSTVQVLQREALLDPRRAAAMTSLSQAGPAELRSAAEYAAAVGDRVLASAALTIASRDSKKHSQFDFRAYADGMIGPEVTAMQERIAGLKIKLAAMRNTEHLFRTGKNAANHNIKAGLAQRALRGK